jgi:hypothetical protein
MGKMIPRGKHLAKNQDRKNVLSAAVVKKVTGSKKVSSGDKATQAAGKATKAATEPEMSLADQIAANRKKVEFRCKVVDAPVARSVKMLNDSDWEKYDKVCKKSFSFMTSREKKKILRGPKKKGKRAKACKGG